MSDFWQVYKDTAPEKLAGMSDDSLDACYRYFVDAHPNLPGRYQESDRLAAEGRMVILHNEKERRRMNAQHEATLNQGKDTLLVGSKTLFWAKAAVVAAVVIPIVVALIQEMLPSKTHLAMPIQSPQPSPPKIEASPEPLETAAPPSVSPQASATPSKEESPPK